MHLQGTKATGFNLKQIQCLRKGQDLLMRDPIPLLPDGLTEIVKQISIMHGAQEG